MTTETEEKKQDNERLAGVSKHEIKKGHVILETIPVSN